MTDRRKFRPEWVAHLATFHADVQAQALRDDALLAYRQRDHHCWKGLCLAPAVVSIDAGGKNRMGLCDFHGRSLAASEMLKGRELRDYEWSEEVRAATHRLIALDLTPWWDGDEVTLIDLPHVAGAVLGALLEPARPRASTS